MATELESLRLGDVALKVGSGATPRGGKEVYLASGPVALIRSQNVRNDGFSRSGLVHIDDTQAYALRNVVVEEGDVLLNITGESVARAAQVDPLVLPARVNQHVAIIRPDPARLDARYLRYWLVSRPVQARLLGLASSGATRNALTKAMIEDLTIDAPPVEEQLRVAHILGTLDDKIELNRRVSATLEEMARTLFKSWFVDFDPVRAKAEGRDTGLPPHIADLFPDRLVDSELGEIPDGWTVSGVTSEFDILSGGTPKTGESAYWGADVPWFSVVDAPAPSAVWVTSTEKSITRLGLESSPATLLPPLTTILTARGTVGKVALAAHTMTSNQSCYGLVSRTGSPYFAYFRTLTLVGELRQRSHGSVFATITRGTLDGLEVAQPPAAIQLAFDGSVGALLGRLLALAIETKALTDGRDALLRELIG